MIVPHRSLSAAGMRRVVTGLLGLNTLVCVGLCVLGAWPVIGFTGIEIVLAIWLLRRNASAARASELVRLSAAGLRVVRTDARGRRSEQHLDVAWLRATLEERPGQTAALLLHDRDRRIEVGAALGETEKRDLATALRQALDRQRNPVFDNPQLRG